MYAKEKQRAHWDSHACSSSCQLGTQGTLKLHLRSQLARSAKKRNYIRTNVSPSAYIRDPFLILYSSRIITKTPTHHFSKKVSAPPCLGSAGNEHGAVGEACCGVGGDGPSRDAPLRGRSLIRGARRRACAYRARSCHGGAGDVERRRSPGQHGGHADVRPLDVAGAVV